MRCLCSVKYLEFHGWLWGGTVAWLTGLGGLFGHLKFPRILLLHHLLGKAVFPTRWECIYGGVWAVEFMLIHKIIIIIISSYYFLLFWPCVDAGLVRTDRRKQLLKIILALTEALNNQCWKSSLCFWTLPELNLLILTWPSHPWSCFQTQLFHIVLFRPSSVHSVSCLWLSRNGTFPWTI